MPTASFEVDNPVVYAAKMGSSAIHALTGMATNRPPQAASPPNIHADLSKSGHFLVSADAETTVSDPQYHSKVMRKKAKVESKIMKIEEKACPKGLNLLSIDDMDCMEAHRESLKEQSRTSNPISNAFSWKGTAVAWCAQSLRFWTAMGIFVVVRVIVSTGVELEGESFLSQIPPMVTPQANSYFCSRFPGWSGGLLCARTQPAPVSAR